MNALALVEAPDHVCCRYRIRAFEPALAASGGRLTVKPLARGVIARIVQFSRAGRYEAVVLQRKLLAGYQLRELRRRVRHLIFDFDDAVPYRDSYDQRGPYCPRRAARFAQTVRCADTVIAGNDFLADCALRAGAPAERVRVIPTCVEPARYPLAAHAATGAEAQLVWVGSSSTLQGLERLRPLWEWLGRELPGLRLRLIADRFPSFGPLPIIAVAWSERTEAAEIARADLGIAWMPDDLWSRGKCGLKVLQYQAAGLPVIANPVGVHTEMIEPGVTGFLAETTDDWIKAIRTLIADPPLRRRMGQAARASVERGYSVSAWASTFVAAVTGAGPSPAPRFEDAVRDDPRALVAAPSQSSFLGRGPVLRARPRRSTRPARTSDTHCDD
jgi:glycosyltransferase involved in cell wall biosynthesis